MDDNIQGQDNSSQTDMEQETAVPYIPPPPPSDSSSDSSSDSLEKKLRSPVMNGALIALVILIGGFMTYNFVGHQLTRLSAASAEVTATPSPSPTISPK